MHSKKSMESSPKPGLPAPGISRVVPSGENMRAILLRAFEIGCVYPSEHFGERSELREFSMLDAEYLIEIGEMGEISFEAAYQSFKCEVSGTIDGKSWKLVAALEADCDLCSAPRITLVTAHRIRKQRVNKKE